MQSSISATKAPSPLLPSFPFHSPSLLSFRNSPLCHPILAPPPPLLRLPPLSSSSSGCRSRRRETLKTHVVSRPEFHPELWEGDEVWLERLPDKRESLNSHTLQCVQAWLKKLGFRQNREDRARFSIERPDWHAEIALDVTELHIRYLNNGTGNLKKDVDRHLSYSMSREDIENAILRGP